MRLKRDQRAKLAVVTRQDGPSDQEIRALLRAGGFEVESYTASYGSENSSREATYAVRRRSLPTETATPAAILTLASHSGVDRVAWRPES